MRIIITLVYIVLAIYVSNTFGHEMGLLVLILWQLAAINDNTRTK